VSVHARSEGRGREGGSSCWAGCRERSHHHPGGTDGRAEKGRTRRCAMLEGDEEERGQRTEYRRRGERRGGEGGEGKGEGKGTAPSEWRGGEREGGQTG